MLGASPWRVSWAYSCGMTQAACRPPGLSSRGLESFSSPAWTSARQVAELPGEEAQAASPCEACALQVSGCHSHLILLVKAGHMVCTDSRRWEIGSSSWQEELHVCKGMGGADMAASGYCLTCPFTPFHLFRSPNQTPDFRTPSPSC